MRTPEPGSEVEFVLSGGDGEREGEGDGFQEGGGVGRGCGWRVEVVWSRFNDRLFVVRYELSHEGSESEEEEKRKRQATVEEVLRALKNCAQERSVGKICFKLRETDLDEPRAQEELGCVIEGRIPGFYRDGTTAIYLVCYLDPKRSLRQTLLSEEEIRTQDEAFERLLHPLDEHHKLPMNTTKTATLTSTQDPDYVSELLFQSGLESDSATSAHEEKERQDAEGLARLFEEVFETYPYPVSDPDYLLRTSRRQPTCVTLYRVLRQPSSSSSSSDSSSLGGEIIAAAAAEVDLVEGNAEVTDFAILPTIRGRGLGSRLLREIEEDVRRLTGVRDLYSIARAASIPMLAVLLKNGYQYQGTLVNNCIIGTSRFETLRLFTKRLGEEETHA